MLVNECPVCGAEPRECPCPLAYQISNLHRRLRALESAPIAAMQQTIAELQAQVLLLTPKPSDGRVQCVICGQPESEHHHDGACYGICGKFVNAAPTNPSSRDSLQLNASQKEAAKAVWDAHTEAAKSDVAVGTASVPGGSIRLVCPKCGRETTVLTGTTKESATCPQCQPVSPSTRPAPASATAEKPKVTKVGRCWKTSDGTCIAVGWETTRGPLESKWPSEEMFNEMTLGHTFAELAYLCVTQNPREGDRFDCYGEPRVVRLVDGEWRACVPDGAPCDPIKAYSRDGLSNFRPIAPDAEKPQPAATEAAVLTADQQEYVAALHQAHENRTLTSHERACMEIIDLLKARVAELEKEIQQDSQDVGIGIASAEQFRALEVERDALAKRVGELERGQVLYNGRSAIEWHASWEETIEQRNSACRLARELEKKHERLRIEIIGSLAKADICTLVDADPTAEGEVPRRIAELAGERDTARKDLAAKEADHKAALEKMEKELEEAKAELESNKTVTIGLSERNKQLHAKAADYYRMYQAAMDRLTSSRTGKIVEAAEELIASKTNNGWIFEHMDKPEPLTAFCHLVAACKLPADPPSEPGVEGKLAEVRQELEALTAGGFSGWAVKLLAKFDAALASHPQPSHPEPRVQVDDKGGAWVYGRGEPEYWENDIFQFEIEVPESRMRPGIRILPPAEARAWLAAHPKPKVKS